MLLITESVCRHRFPFTARQVFFLFGGLFSLFFGGCFLRLRPTCSQVFATIWVENYDLEPFRIPSDVEFHHGSSCHNQIPRKPIKKTIVFPKNLPGSFQAKVHFQKVLSKIVPQRQIKYPNIHHNLQRLQPFFFAFVNCPSPFKL